MTSLFILKHQRMAHVLKKSGECRAPCGSCSNIRCRQSPDEFKQIINKHERVAVDFSAKWCGPCLRIQPKFEDISRAFGSIKTVKVDVDDNPYTSKVCGVSPVPTFQFYLKGQKVDELVGASEEKLKQKLESLSAAQVDDIPWTFI